MLARSRKFTFKNNAELKTPILVPSISSKGWRFKKDGDRELSEINEVLRWSTEVITESVLLSAYDIYHKYIDGPEELGEFSEITIIDSGGYETADDHDLSSVYTFPWPTKPWRPEMLDEVIKSLPKENNIAIVNFDHGKKRKTLSEQITEASVYFNNNISFDHIFLIKPETQDQDYVQIDNIIKNIKKLNRFDIIGLTEKELGNSFHDRMHNIATIRSALDSEEIHAPIHIFGALDPVATVLYFLSGAEIFDGLTWIRYAYHDGFALYNENYRAIYHGPKVKLKQATTITLMKNLNYMESLKDQMINFTKNGDFNAFDYNSEHFKKIYDGFNSRH